MKKIYGIILGALVFLLLPTATASAQTQTVFVGGVGEVPLEDVVRMERNVGEHGKINYQFFSKDGEIQRCLQMNEVETKQMIGREKAQEEQQIVSAVLRSRKIKNVLQVMEPQELKLDNDADGSSFTIFLNGHFVVSAIQNIRLKGKHDVKLVTFNCAAGDVNYWTPLIKTILNRIELQ